MEARLAVITREFSIVIYVKDILYMESIGRKIKIVTTHGDYCQQGQIKKIKADIGNCFCWPLKNLPVNLDQVKSLSSGVIIFKNGLEMWVGERAYRIVKKDFNNYLKENMISYY